MIRSRYETRNRQNAPEASTASGAFLCRLRRAKTNKIFLLMLMHDSNRSRYPETRRIKRFKSLRHSFVEE